MNTQIIKLVYLKQTNTKHPRIKLSSSRGETVILQKDHGVWLSDSAKDYLIAKQHKLLCFCTGSLGDFIVLETLHSIK